VKSEGFAGAQMQIEERGFEDLRQVICCLLASILSV
jgi:hypothetical protein